MHIPSPPRHRPTRRTWWYRDVPATPNSPSFVPAPFPPLPPNLSTLKPGWAPVGAGRRSVCVGGKTAFPSPAFLGSETQELAGHSCFLWPPLLRCRNKSPPASPGNPGVEMGEAAGVRRNVPFSSLFRVFQGDRGRHGPRGPREEGSRPELPPPRGDRGDRARPVASSPGWEMPEGWPLALGWAFASPPSRCHHIAMETEPRRGTASTPVWPQFGAGSQCGAIHPWETGFIPPSRDDASQRERMLRPPPPLSQSPTTLLPCRTKPSPPPPPLHLPHRPR